MGVHATTVASTTIITAAPANAVDALLVTTPAMGLPIDGAQVLLFWFVTFLTGAAATGFSARLRRGAAVASTLINVSLTNNVVAANTVTLAGCYTDQPGVSAGLQYSLTGIVTGGAAAVTISDVCLIAMCL